jgi:predicted SPOUT superfamily RNA methylase MTH1
MEQAPCRGQPRTATVSIAIPGSIVANCQTRELKTQITGQIARAATIYHVDEIIVFDDCLSKKGGVGPGSYHQHRQHSTNNNHRHRNSDKKHGSIMEDPQSHNGAEGGGDDNPEHPGRPPSDPHAFMARILQYAECPQYLRRHFFPMHPDLQFVGLLPPVDAPHHVREDDRCPFREGVVLLDKAASAAAAAAAARHTNNKGSLVNCGIRGRPVQCVHICCC